MRMSKQTAKICYESATQTFIVYTLVDLRKKKNQLSLFFPRRKKEKTVDEEQRRLYTLARV